MLPEEATRWLYKVFWFGVALNALFPIGEGVSGVLLTTDYDKTDALKKLYVLSMSITVLGTNIVQICSGTILICSIMKIKKQMALTYDGEVDVNTLVLHSAAFGLYLISITGLVVVYIFYISSAFSKRWTTVMLSTNTGYYICSFFAQCLLIVIFWQLASPNLDESYVTTTIYEPITV